MCGVQAGTEAGASSDDEQTDKQPSRLDTSAHGAAAPPPALEYQPPGSFAGVAEDPTEEALAGVMQRVFGFQAFRGQQLAVIQNVLRHRSTLAIMPTGLPLPPPACLPTSYHPVCCHSKPCHSAT